MKHFLNCLLTLAILCTGVQKTTAQSEIDSAKYYFEHSKYQQSSQLYKQWFSKTKRSHTDYKKNLYDYASSIEHEAKYSMALNHFLELKSQLVLPKERQLELLVKIKIADLYRSIDKLSTAGEQFAKIRFSHQDSVNFPYEHCKYYHRIAAYYNQYHTAHNSQEALAKALVFSRKSLAISKRKEYIKEQAVSYNEIGNLLEKNGQLDSAVIYYQNAMDVWKSLGTMQYYSNALFNKTTVYVSLNKIDSAIILYNENLKLIEENDWPTIRQYIYYYLSKIYADKGDVKRSMEYRILQQKEINRDIKEKYDKEIASTQVKYESKKKDEQLKLNAYKLKSQSELIEKTESRNFLMAVGIFLLIVVITLGLVFYFLQKRKNLELKALVAENKFLVSESNHRIKNNLQLITSIIHQEKEKSDDVNREVLSDISSKIDAIALLHRDLNLASNEGQVELKEYLHNLFDDFGGFLKKANVDVTLECEELQIGLDQGVYVGILISELVTNSLKHAFDNQDSPEILLAAYKKENKLMVEYIDNGKGLGPDSEQPKLLSLISSKLSGTVDYAHGKGFNVKFEFGL